METQQIEETETIGSLLTDLATAINEMNPEDQETFWRLHITAQTLKQVIALVKTGQSINPLVTMFP